MDNRNSKRARRLAACGLVEGKPATPYDQITRRARRTFDVETAAFCVMGEQTPWTPSHAGAAMPDADAEAVFCRRAMQHDAPMVVANACADPRFADHPAVAGPPYVRFIAGAPVVMPDGLRFGALLLLDAEPRALDPDEVALLEELANLLAEQADLQCRLRAMTRDAAVPVETPPSGRPGVAAAISENIAEGIFRSVPGQRLVYVNQACARMFAYDTPEELLQADPRTLYASPDQRDAAIVHLDQEGSLDGMAVRFMRKDGSAFWGLMSARVTYDDAGRVRYHDGTVVDITHRKEMEQQLRESEERWHRLVENHPEAVLINVEGQFRYANPAGARLLGVPTPDDLVGRPVFDFLMEKDQPVIQERQEMLNQGKSTAPIEHEIVRPDGTRRVVEVNSVPITYEGQAAVQTVARDVTDRQRAEERLRAAEAKFRGLVEQSLVGIYIIQDGRIAYINPALAEIVGYPVDDLVGADAVTRFIHEDDQAMVRRKIRQRNQGEIEDARYTFRIRQQDGTVRHVEAHGTRMEHGDQSAIIGTLLDVTERKEWERNLIAAKEEAEEMNRLKSAFLANMSHEIRTPLTSIIGFADLIGTSPESASEFAALIRRSGKRLLWMLNSVLDLAQLEAGALKLHAERVDLTGEVREILDEFRPQAQQKNNTLQLDVPEAPVRGSVDRGAFLRIVTNLVSNAIKFTRDGRVTVVLRPDGNAVEMRVEDTGIGIGEDFLDQIFDEFRQESTGEARTHEGSGLGLTITQRLVELMDGTIAVDSTPAEGSTFTVRLPRAGEEGVGERESG